MSAQNRCFDSLRLSSPPTVILYVTFNPTSLWGQQRWLLGNSSNWGDTTEALHFSNETNAFLYLLIYLFFLLSCKNSSEKKNIVGGFSVSRSNWRLQGPQLDPWAGSWKPNSYTCPHKLNPSSLLVSCFIPNIRWSCLGKRIVKRFSSVVMSHHCYVAQRHRHWSDQKCSYATLLWSNWNFDHRGPFFLIRMEFI